MAGDSSFGFCRVAVAVPRLRLADPAANAVATVEVLGDAAGAGASVVVFPELGLSGYSVDDLFHQRALLDAAHAALLEVAAATAGQPPLVFVGLPLLVGHRLYNVAAALHDGRVVGVVPKSYLPNYREFYEERWFAASREAVTPVVELGGQQVPFGADLLFESTQVPDLVVQAEVCEDVWVPIPPSTYGAMAGATVLANLSASNVTVGKAAYRHELASSQSARTIAAYLYTSAGFGESTTDLAWDGHGLVYEDGRLLAETRRFDDAAQLLVADVDLERLVADRMRMGSYGDCVTDHRNRLGFRRVAAPFGCPAPVPLRRRVDRFPFVPSGERHRAERCEEAYQIQVQGLVTRMAATGIERLVIGVSGGLDSAHALLVACRAVDALGLPRTNVHAVTMPGFATSGTTKANAIALMTSLGVEQREIDIRPSCTQMLLDLGHPAGRGEPVYDITFENVQAGERTSHLFRLANHVGGIVVGTGDLSELALGWCTYGVGDQMAHYNVNASVPKTLMQFLIRWVATTDQFGDEANATLLRIVDTEISPELVPSLEGEEIGQRTEDIVGPYELHDFFLYHVLRYGLRPSKVAFLARQAWGDEYDDATIVRWLRAFLDRFFRTSQFKRSAMPNGPKIGSGGSLSPRGDWRAPSDAPSTVWLADLDAYAASIGLT